MKGISGIPVRKTNGHSSIEAADFVVVEEPLEIRLGYLKNGALRQKSISVTMRTPGDDEALALGFLFTEGLIQSFSQVLEVSRPPVRWRQAEENALLVKVTEDLESRIDRLERHFYTTSSCGVCGKASIEAIQMQSQFELIEYQPLVNADVIRRLPEKLLQNQSLFGNTGGLHGVALFNATGELLQVKEDVGRHNALDKLIGNALTGNQLPLLNCLLLVSGRAGFELVQKSVTAGIPILAAVGAPTSLSVELAEESGMTLIGFLRNGQFNIYTHPERVIFPKC
jgi:FdhD protein